jgi:hypothetical protein
VCERFALAALEVPTQCIESRTHSPIEAVHPLDDFEQWSGCERNESHATFSPV